ncbi:hypothetical protein B0H13DRAFT_1863999 [Mycena leptocephala]|nr:hypothetical protein B0H13DRAFT_1863999 [Mycena leptocephala]
MAVLKPKGGKTGSVGARQFLETVVGQVVPRYRPYDALTHPTSIFPRQNGLSVMRRTFVNRLNSPAQKTETKTVKTVYKRLYTEKVGALGNSESASSKHWTETASNLNAVQKKSQGAFAIVSGMYADVHPKLVQLSRHCERNGDDGDGRRKQTDRIITGLGPTLLAFFTVGSPLCGEWQGCRGNGMELGDIVELDVAKCQRYLLIGGLYVPEFQYDLSKAPRN